MAIDMTTAPAPAAPRPPLAALALCIFAANMGLGIIFPLIPHLAAGSQAGAEAVGWIFSSYAATLVLAQIAGGVLADRYNAVRVLGWALGLYLLTLLAFIVARGVPALLVVRALEGAAIGLIIPSVMQLVVRMVPPERLGRGIGFVMGLGGIGFIAGPLIGGHLAPFGLALPFLAAAAVAGIAALMVGWKLKPGDWPQPVGHTTQPPLARALGFELGLVGRRLRQPVFWGLVLPLMAVKINFSTMQAGLPLIGDRVLSVSLPAVSYLFVITAVAYGVVQPLAGRLADRYATRWLITVAFIGMAPLLALMAYQTTYAAFMLPYALFSVFQCGAALLAMKHLGDALGEGASGRAFGLAAAIGDMGMVLAPSLLLPLFAWRHESLLLALAGVMLLALALFWCLPRGPLGAIETGRQAL